MSTLRQSLGFSFMERYLLICLQLLSFTLLARLLTPQQIGLYSVSIALVSIAQVIRDFGLVNYLIQHKTLEREDIGSALGLALLLGGTLFLLVNATAPLVGAFYNDASLTRIVHIISLNFLILPFNSILTALLRRDMQFSMLMRLNVCAAVVSTSTTLGLAWAGFGSSSLAWGDIASSLTLACGMLVIGAARRLPRPQLTRWRAILGIGGPLTLANIATSISIDINELVLGKLLNFTQVAINSRAQGLMHLFNRDLMDAIRSVAYPAYARASRAGSMLEQEHVASVSAVTAVAWPFYGFIGLFPLEVLRLMFGMQWDLSAPLVPWFCLAGAFSAMANLIPTLMLAAGHAKLMATADMLIQPAKAITLSLVVYYYRDLTSLAIAFVIVSVLAVPYFYAFKQCCLPTDFAAMARQLAKNLVLAGLSLAPALAIVLWQRPAGQALPYPWFFACVAATAIAWLLLLWVLKHPLHREFVNLVWSPVSNKLQLLFKTP
ncbi:MAG: oligosaccharide flippase family protein [Pseudomonadota bacterium]